MSLLTFPNQEFIQKLEGRGQKLSEEEQKLETENNQLRDNLARHISNINALMQDVKVISDENAANSQQNEIMRGHRTETA